MKVNQEALEDLVGPLTEVDLNINNQTYNEYEKGEVFIKE